jgi:molybdopterin synthase catalytic subunit
MKISVQTDDFDLSTEVIEISANPRTGAVASFVGQVREVAMTLEHYPGMTENAIRAIVEEARSRWQILDCVVIHRYGDLEPGDQIVLVAIAAAHRGDAFAACQFIMDYLNTRRRSGRKSTIPRARAGSTRATPMTKPPRAGAASSSSVYSSRELRLGKLIFG